MRAFVIFCCLATAYAASLGYDYERNNGGGHEGGAGGGGIGISFEGLNGGLLGGGSYDGLDGGLGGGFGGQGVIGGELGGLVGGQGSLSGTQGSLSGGYGGHGGADHGVAELNKEFYTFSAPEHEFDNVDTNHQLSDSLKKNLRVVFIKGPESTGLENAALQLAKSASDDRTAIYVLNKQADIGELANKLNSLQSINANKPEVHFVKYRTAADAANAQHAIQQQYNNLGGSTSSHNGGVAPVLDFASKASVVNSGGYDSGPSHGGFSHQGGSLGGSIESHDGYLPPNRRF